MVRYRRSFIPGGTYFFTVTLADPDILGSRIKTRMGPFNASLRAKRSNPES
jgi:hypothetical protein